jgi:AhpD family alkylhydroperoxidase
MLVARIPYPDMSQLPPDAAAAWATVPPVKLLHMTAHSPSLLPQVVGMSTAIMTRLDIDPVLREMIIIRMAHLTGGEYHLGMHIPVAEAAGASSAQLNALKNPEGNPDVLDARQRLGLSVVDMVLGRECTTADIDALRGEFTDRQIVEMFLVAGTAHSLIRLTTALAVDLDNSGESVIAFVHENTAG